MASSTEQERAWHIWVCGCKDKVETTEWAYDEGMDQATTCGSCKEPHREIEVIEREQS